MIASLKKTADPSVEPVLLPDAKLHLRIDVTDDDTLITGYIIAARQACEEFIRAKLISQTWEIAFDSFPTDGSPIRLPIAPLLSVQSVSWADQTNAITTMTLGTDYLVDTESEPGRLVLPPNNAWPGASLWPVQPIKVEVTAGFGADGTTVPKLYWLGMLQAIGHWYENREAVAMTGAIPKEVPLTTTILWTLGGRYHNYAYMNLDT